MRRALQFILTARAYRLGALLPKGSAKGELLRWLLGSSERSDDAPRGERLRRALESLGPVSIKFGQLLSTRRDLLPDDIADDLARLQDEVAPFASATAIDIIERELAKPVNEAFASFETEPLAAASVAQVHAVTLPDGEAAVVKVLRPEIGTKIAADIRLLKRIAVLIDRLSDDFKRLRLPEVVADYELTISTELDLRREAANASLLKKNTAQRKLVFIPTIFWDYSTPRVMVSERISGVPIRDITALNNAKVDMKLLAERGVEIFFSQVFDDCFFHADMHPGNIFVDITTPQSPTYIAVDCAIVGQLSREDQYYVARNLLAILQRNYRLVAELHIESGWVPPSTRVQDFESTIRMLCEPIFDRPLNQISLGHMLVNLFRAASSFDMKIQPQLVLLQKTLLNIEGLGRQLYPELNLWETAKPFLEDWLKRQYSPRNVVRQLQRDAPAFIHHASQLPEVLPQFLAAQKRMLNEPHRQEAHARDSHYWIGSGVATLVITLVANLQSHWYPVAGLCLVLLGLIRLRQ